MESPVIEWLLPHMHLRKHKAGEVLFRKGDMADEIVYVASGKLKLQGIDRGWYWNCAYPTYFLGFQYLPTSPARWHAAISPQF